MQLEKTKDLDSQKHHYLYNYELERQKKIFATALLFFSIFTFFLTIIGFTDGISEIVNSALVHSLGYNNQWSQIIGPDWFVMITEDISALGGAVVIFIFLTAIAGYYYLKREEKRLWKLLFVVVGGGIILQFLKIIFAEEFPHDPTELITSAVSSYPSGHAMMATIFYLTVAVYRTRRHGRQKVRRYTIISAAVIVFLVGISRVLHGSHTVTEVLAGWSAGMIWLCLVWFLERYIKKNRSVV